MSIHDSIRQLLSQFSGHDRIVTIPKLYIEITGDLVESVLLNQIVFYADKSSRTDGFFYKTYSDWEDETCLTERQVRHAAKKLKAKGLIETKVLKANGSPTVHYKLLSDNLVEWIMTKGKERNLQNVRNDTDKTSVSLTYDYTDDYTEDKRVNASSDKKREHEEHFEAWWNLYDNKKDRKKCSAKYKLLLKQYPQELMLAGTEKYIQHLINLGKRGEFVPQQRNPLTFLNGENFNDEYESQSLLVSENRKVDEFSLDLTKGEEI